MAGRLTTTRPGISSTAACEGSPRRCRLESRIRTEGSTELAAVELAPGANEIDIPIPWTSAELVAYPTNFGKKLGGLRYNARG